MSVTANGEPRETEVGQSLEKFLETLDLSPKRVVVERNGEALSPSEVGAVILQDGDRLEIVRIVAGG